MEFFEDGHVELFNLREDPGEINDMAEARPEKTREMAAKLTAWRTTVDARPALANPEYDIDLASKKSGLRYKPRWNEAQPLVNPEVLE